MDDIASCQLSQELLEVNVVISRISPLLSEEAIQAKKILWKKKHNGRAQQNEAFQRIGHVASLEAPQATTALANGGLGPGGVDSWDLMKGLLLRGTPRIPKPPIYH